MAAGALGGALGHHAWSLGSPLLTNQYRSASGDEEEQAQAVAEHGDVDEQAEEDEEGKAAAAAATAASAATPAAEARGAAAGGGQRGGRDDQRHRHCGQRHQREATAPAHAADSRSGPMPGSDWTMCWSAW